MTKRKAETAVVIAPAVAQAVDRIKALQDGIVDSMQGFAQGIVLCGLELTALKKQVGHGKWLGFFEDNLEGERFSYRTSARYMAVAKAAKAKFAKLGNFDETRLLAAPSEMQEADLDAIRAAIADMTDATSWQQIMLDLGLVRQEKPRGGYHPGDGDATREAEEMTYRALWPKMVDHLWDHAVKQKTYAYLTQAQLEGIRGKLIDITRAIREAVGK